MSRSPRAGVIEVPDNRVPMMGEMGPDLMGAPCLELAFDQAVSPDFFQLRHLSLHTDLFVDPTRRLRRRSDRVGPILVDDGSLC